MITSLSDYFILSVIIFAIVLSIKKSYPIGLNMKKKNINQTLWRNKKTALQIVNIKRRGV